MEPQKKQTSLQHIIPTRQVSWNPLVTVIIPTFNRAAMVKEAVESVLHQTYREFELIVVDDGSTDNTQETLAAYAPWIQVIHQDNRGVSAARNRGISQAKGDLIAFLDSDDLWLPEKLTRQVAFFQANPDALICQTEEIWIRNGVRIYPKPHHKKESGMIFHRSLRLCLVSPSAVMVRRRLFQAVGMFDEDLPACEDYDLWLRVTCRIPVYLIDEPLIIKRGGHEDQLSSTPALDKFRIRSIVNLLANIPLTKDQYQAAVEVLTEKCQIYATGCRKRGRIQEAEAIMTLAASFHQSDLG